jgi:hypothetical protein
MPKTKARTLKIIVMTIRIGTMILASCFEDALLKELTAIFANEGPYLGLRIKQHLALN